MYCKTLNELLQTSNFKFSLIHREIHITNIIGFYSHRSSFRSLQHYRRDLANLTSGRGLIATLVVVSACHFIGRCTGQPTALLENFTKYNFRNFKETSRAISHKRSVYMYKYNFCYTRQ